MRLDKVFQFGDSDDGPGALGCQAPNPEPPGRDRVRGSLRSPNSREY